jgi:hypothetical protein
MNKGSFGGQGFASAALQRPLEAELRNKYGSDFKYIVMSRWDEGHILSAGETKISQVGRFMQPDAPDMLSLEMLKGTRAGLKDPSSILLSASAAKAIFGDADPLDKMMRIDNQMDVKVTGVYKDLPHSTEFSNVKFLSSWDLLLAHNKWMKDAADDWGNSSFLIYVQLQPIQLLKPFLRESKMQRMTTWKRWIKRKISDFSKSHESLAFVFRMEGWKERRRAHPVCLDVQRYWCICIVACLHQLHEPKYCP